MNTFLYIQCDSNANFDRNIFINSYMSFNLKLIHTTSQQQRLSIASFKGSFCCFAQQRLRTVVTEV